MVHSLIRLTSSPHEEFREATFSVNDSRNRFSTREAFSSAEEKKTASKLVWISYFTVIKRVVHAHITIHTIDDTKV